MTSPRIGTRRAYAGRILNLDVDSVRFPDGSEGELEMIRHPGAAAVLPFLGRAEVEDPEVLLIRQYRYAAERYLYEIPAGRLEPGEEPEACAARELMEETGYSAKALRRLTTIFTTPGFTDERIHLFAAEELTRGQTAREADEFMELVVLRFSDVLRLVKDGEIEDAKSLVAILYGAQFVLP